MVETAKMPRRTQKTTRIMKRMEGGEESSPAVFESMLVVVMRGARREVSRRGLPVSEANPRYLYRLRLPRLTGVNLPFALGL